MKTKAKYLFLSLGIILYSFFSYKTVKFDLTEDKKFTLNDSSKKIVSSIDDDVFIDIYLCGDMSVHFRKLQSQLFDLINNIKVYSHNHLFVRQIDIQKMDDQEREKTIKFLGKQGLFATNIMQIEKGKRIGHTIYPCLVVRRQNKEIGINLLSAAQRMISQEQTINKSIENLEYNIVNGIFQLFNNSKSKIAIIIGHEEPLDLRLNGFIHSLKTNYDLSFEKLDKETLKKRLDVMLLTKPIAPFNENEKYIIDQFIMQGGRVLFFIDRMKTNVEEMIDGKSFAVPLDLNLDDMLFRYGVRLQYNLIKDLQSGIFPIVTGNIGNQPQINMIPIPFFVLANTNDKHVISKNLNQVYSKFVSKIEPINVEGIKHTPLLYSSIYSYCIGNPVIFDLNELKKEPDMNIYCKGPIPIAYLVEGNFSSLYKGRLVPEGYEEINQKNSGEHCKILVTTGADMILNTISPDKKYIFPLGMNPFTQQQFANQDFILNSISYMINPDGLINAKNKNYKIHTLDNKKISEYSLLIQSINVLLPLIINFLITIILNIKRRRYIYS